jgi:CHAT domain-containing protein
LICLERFQNMAAFDDQLDRLKSALPSPPQPDCPESTVWREIAAAVTPSDLALTHLQHASRCDHCGPQLRQAISEMDGTLTESEAKLIAALKSARPEWQRGLAQRITGTPISAAPPWWKAWATAPRLAFSGVALAAMMVAGLWLALREAQPVPPNSLLAIAYSDQRTFEMRISGAPHAPVRVQRGAEGSFLSRPAALLKAEAIIAAQIGSHASDPNWLQAKARADLLEGKYDSAVDALRHALQIAPKSPGLLIDLGTAYFQRAQGADRPEDLGAAYESLSQALAGEPENPVALFNRAIVAENQFLFHQALDDWDHYLRLDPASDWAVEARGHADKVRAKVNEHDQSHAAPLLTPAQIAAQLGNADLRAQLDQRVEEYLHEAVRSWLPQAYPEGKAAPDPSARQALFFLADLTAQQHGDRWLSDLIAGSSAPQFPPAVAALAAAVKASDVADYDNSAKHAVAAEQSFQKSGNAAGVLYAQFEQAFSKQLTRQTRECRRGATVALAQAEALRYSWLQIQLGLEKAVCSLLGQNNWGADERLSSQAMERAQQSSYDGLYLRALFFVAEDQVATGDLAGGLKSASIGLQHYWSSYVTPDRGYNIYYLLGSMPEFYVSRPNLVSAAWREAMAVIDFSADFRLRAWAHSSAGLAAATVHQSEIAAREYAKAARLFATAPNTEAIQNDILWNEIRTADIEARLGQFESGVARLARIQEQLRGSSDKNIAEAFYATLGGLQLRSHHDLQAEQAFQPALESAEKRLLSLNTEAERINWSKEAAPMYLGMAEAKLRLGRVAESLEYFEWYLGAGGRSKEKGTNKIAHEATPNSSSFASRLPLLFQATVIAFAALPDGIAIWTYDNRGVNVQWTERSSQDLQEVVSRFLALASIPGSEMAAVQRDAESLYRALVAPIEPRLEPDRTLVIEADGWLGQVPFEALLDANGHYLIERAPIVHSLSQSTDALLHESLGISRNLPALIVASSASSPNEGLVPLPDSSAEAEAVAADFDSARILKGRHSTLAAVEEGLPLAAVFHFSGHSAARSAGSGLLLLADDPQSPPLLLGADKLRRLELRNLRLAVLSTCNTESGKDGSRAFSSITEGLLRNGVPHVVASRWAVDSVETRQFIESFYNNALSGHRISEAIRQTARSMMANPRTSHPYYWAAFSAYGRP